MIAKTMKQHRCPSTDEQIKKIWYLNTMEYYVTVKKNETMLFSATWMNLKIIILSTVSQRKTKTYGIAFMWNLKK